MVTKPTPFAVVIPLFQKRAYVARAVESVLDQSHPASELIVVDDGSTDGGGDEVRRLFPRVRVIRQENSGVGAARNLGIDETTSPWIALLDADDYWTPQHLEQLARMVAFDPEAVLLSTRWKRVVHGTSETLATSGDGSIKRIDYFMHAAKRGGPVWTSSAAISRRAYEHIGGFGSASLGEDQEYWARLALFGPVVVSSAVTAAYVRGVESVTETHRRSARAEIVPRTAADALPVFATVESALESDESRVPKASLHAFWNAKIAGKTGEAVSRSEFERARALASFMKPPLTSGERLLARGVQLPTWTLRCALALRRRIRQRDRSGDT